MNAIIGHTGYVGSYLKTKVLNCDYYNSKNINDIKHKTYDTVYFAGLPATKWLVNLNAEKDMQNMIDIQNILKTCHIRKVILISTIDVYDKNIMQQNEDDEHFTDEPYGRHRRLMEEWVIANFEYHILRLPALFGMGLKKNALYDLLNHKYVIRPLDEYQWYYLDDLWDDIDYVLFHKIKLINLFTKPIIMKEILLEIFEDTVYPTTNTPIKYDFKTKYDHTGYFDRDILKKMKLFKFMYQLEKTRYVVSNLCWQNDLALHILKRYNIEYLELAITKYMNWYDDITIIQNKFKDFKIYSMQSLFYGIRYNVFINNEEFMNHFKHVIDIAEKLSVQVLVFGSPQNRKIPDTMKYEEAVRIFVNTFRKLHGYLPYGMKICLENNAEQYGCNFMTTVEETLDIVQKINCPNIKMNLDHGNMIMMNDQCRDLTDVGHVHISAPYLKDILQYDYNLQTNKKVTLEIKESEQFEANLIKFLSIPLKSLPS